MTCETKRGCRFRADIKHSGGGRKKVDVSEYSARPEQTLATSGGLGSLHRWNSVGHPLNPETVDIVAKDDTQKQRTDTAVQANEWLGEAATSAFGKGTEITGSSVEEVGKRLKVTAETNRGGIAGW